MIKLAATFNICFLLVRSRPIPISETHNLTKDGKRKPGQISGVRGILPAFILAASQRYPRHRPGFSLRPPYHACLLPLLFPPFSFPLSLSPSPLSPSPSTLLD